MSFLSKVLIVVFVLTSFGLNAQDEPMMDKMPKDSVKLISPDVFMKTGITFKALFLDYQTFNGGSFDDFKSYHSGFEIGLHKRIAKNINLNIPVKVGTVPSHIDANDFHKRLYSIDLQAEYHFYKPGRKVIPYIMAGVGAVSEDKGDPNVQIPVGLGVYIRATDKSYVTWESSFRKSFLNGRDNFDHGIGFIYLFGRRAKTMTKPEMKKEIDSDGDGIWDDIDLCPQVAGLENMKGCPDTDGDGVADYQDDCPEFAGLIGLRGCPDTDGDGVSDNDDECPNMAGTKSNKGCPEETQRQDSDKDGIPDDLDKCPYDFGTIARNGCPEPKVIVKEEPKILDTDGDGVPDREDNCPNARGTRAAKGCPDQDGDGVADVSDKCPTQPGLNVYGGCPDTDGDGIDDSRDKCPNQPGTVAGAGCPEISQKDKEVLEFAMRAVQFDSGRSTLKQESFGVLNQIVDIMRRYPNYSLEINGHTDNTGGASTNQNLSERRAKACKDYLAIKGISSSRVSYYGYGESRPIADNDSVRGRALNRRVEFNLVPK